MILREKKSQIGNWKKELESTDQLTLRTSDPDHETRITL
jgi:hypothetical protein